MFVLNNVKYNDVLSIDYMHIKENDITCVVGQSGGGKTTLLRLLNKLISPTEGDIIFQGQNLAHLDSVDHRRKVVLMSQKSVMFEGTIRDNLLKALSYRNQTVNDASLTEVLKKVRLSKKLDDSVKNLSGGEAQRLALARIMLLDIKCVLLDEPSSALDEETEEFIIKTICEFAKIENITLIMVTHRKSIAKAYGTVTYTIDQGFLKKEASL